MTVSKGVSASATALADLTLTTASRVTTGGAGSIYHVHVSWYGTGSAPTVSDSAGNVYVQQGSTAVWNFDGNAKSAIFSCFGGLGDALHTWTATWGANQSAISIYALEILGADSSPLDQQPAGVSDNVIPFASSSATTTQADEFLVFSVSVISDFDPRPITYANSFATVGDDITTTLMGYRIVSSTGTYNGQATTGGTTPDGTICWITCYKAAVEGPSGPAGGRISPNVRLGAGSQLAA